MWQREMKTKSEVLFEGFLTCNGIPFEKIEEVKEKGAYRPDYSISTGTAKIYVELKELADKNLGPSFSWTLGEHVRRCIQSAMKQIQYGADQGIPSILLIYNLLDPIGQMTGTLPDDFISAMRGEYTIQFNKISGEALQMFNGRNQSLHEKKNTSFGALGHLCDRTGETTVTLFENVYSEPPVPYEQLDPCFKVLRADISGPLKFTPRVL
jgi:hypothetical protein